MTSRSALVWLTLLLAGCEPQLGRVRVTVIFENETRTQCIKASAQNSTGNSTNSTPAAIPRAGRDTLLIGVGENSDLVGEIKVTISRFSSAGCSGTAFASETKTTQIAHGPGPTAMLEFRYTGEVVDAGVDAGLDAGPDDAGVDAGCNVAACGNAPGECELTPATGCKSDGGCRFTFKPAQTPCNAGVCNSMGACLSNVCAVLDAGAPCDDGLVCTATSTCQSGACRGVCPSPPVCNLLAQPLACDLVTPTACALRPTADLAACDADGGQCLDGGCLPWLQFNPPNFPTTLQTVPYPTGPWTLASPDGGVCDTVISTAGTTATVTQGDCGSPTITSTINDAGVTVISMTGLDVGPNARLEFVGARPVQLLVLGDASIRGTVSVAPLQGGQLPAGTQPATCSPVEAGLAAKQGGGGGGFGSYGGKGGDSGGDGGIATPLTSPLRGGCPGAPGFRASGSSPPGAGGGALELIVADTLTLSGVVTASGGGGTAGTGNNEGGGGGGSGGAILIVARFINLNGGAVTANGGGGGEGGDSGQTCADGALGPIASDTAVVPVASPGCQGAIGGIGGDNANQNGGDGADSGGKGGGGGGGSVGVILIHWTVSCSKGTGLFSGNQPSPFTCR